MAQFMLQKAHRHAHVQAPRRAPAVARVLRLTRLSLHTASPCNTLRATDPEKAASAAGELMLLPLLPLVLHLCNSLMIRLEVLLPACGGNTVLTC
jgi:hypothetical protein